MSDPAAALSTIVITRNEPDDVQDRWIRIFIDDLPVEIMRYGETLTRQVPAGRHRVKAHNTLSKHIIEFDTVADQPFRIRCHNSVAKGGVLMMLTIGFAFITVRLVPDLQHR